jgi:hypothetical protein
MGIPLSDELRIHTRKSDTLGQLGKSEASSKYSRYKILLSKRTTLWNSSLKVNEIFHVALSYLRMYACGPGTLWGEHPSEQVESIVAVPSVFLGFQVLSEPSKRVSYH